MTGQRAVVDRDDAAFDRCHVTVGHLHQSFPAGRQVGDEFGGAQCQSIVIDDVDVGQVPRRNDAAIAPADMGGGALGLLMDHEFEIDQFTSLAVAGIENPKEPLPEGANLIPFLTEKQEGSPHQALFWRYYFPSQQPKHHSWAIREGDWKLMQYKAWPSPKLFNLADDIGESRDLAEQHPDRVQRLKKLWDEWDAQNFQPDYAAATPAGD